MNGFGEGGIRTRQDPVDSVTYRFYDDSITVNASVAVAPCTLLHARSLDGSTPLHTRMRDSTERKEFTTRSPRRSRGRTTICQPLTRPLGHVSPSVSLGHVQ